MALWARLKFWEKADTPEHLVRGTLGENAAKDFLQRKGMKFLTANFAATRGEIDLVFRDGDCLVFVEVKTRSSEAWTRPSKAVDLRKKKALARTAADYLRLLENPQVRYRFDVIEVLLENGSVREVRHIENSFNTQGIWKPRRR
jgi:putative endonuclease